MSADTISKGKVVSIHYTLHGSDGIKIDSSAGREPMLYLHGYGNIVPGLEKALTGKAVGDAIKTIVKPEEGYGKKRTKTPQRVERAAFPKGAKLAPGAQFMTQDRNGRPTPIFVVKVERDMVLIDTDHPLAGKKLHFEVEVLALRDATKEELEHGHPHGPDGHAGHGHGDHDHGDHDHEDHDHE